MNKHQLTFRQAKHEDLPLIKNWWHKPHVIEFWDTSPKMWQNAEDYLTLGKKDLFDYWLGFCDQQPYALILTSEIDEISEEDPNFPFFSKNGKTWTLDFMIGEESFLGLGLGSETLKAFCKFAHQLDNTIDTFLIDPEASNTKAVHVYQKAGFEIVREFYREEGNWFESESGKLHYMMVKTIK